jgi:hypothetical protein
LPRIASCRARWKGPDATEAITGVRKAAGAPRKAALMTLNTKISEMYEPGPTSTSNTPPAIAPMVSSANSHQ